MQGVVNVHLPYKWMAVESLTDNIFSEKTDVVRIIYRRKETFFSMVHI